MTDILALIALAEKATPGPWSFGADVTGVITNYRDASGNATKDNLARNGYAKTICRVTHGMWASVGEHMANGRLIAAANPAALLPLLRELQAARAVVEAAESAIQDDRRTDDAGIERGGVMFVGRRSVPLADTLRAYRERKDLTNAG